MPNPLFLICFQNPSLWMYTIATNNLTQLCTFPGEQTVSLTSMTVDFSRVPYVAYVTSEPYSIVYAVDTSRGGQVQNSQSASFTPFYTDNNGLQFSGSGLYTNAAGQSTLYLLAHVLGDGAQTTVLSTLAVNGSAPLAATSTNGLYVTAAWSWPDAIAINPAGTIAYIMDGGYREGYVITLPPYETGYIYQCTLTTVPSTCTTLFSTETLFLRGGLTLSTDQSTLLFGATYYLEQLVVNASLITTPFNAPPLAQSSSVLEPTTCPA